MPKLYDHDLVLELWASGCSAGEIYQQVGVSTAQIQMIKKKHGFVKNRNPEQRDT